jgi:hypothetical protein
MQNSLRWRKNDWCQRPLDFYWFTSTRVWNITFWKAVFLQWTLQVFRWSSTANMFTFNAFQHIDQCKNSYLSEAYGACSKATIILLFWVSGISSIVTWALEFFSRTIWSASKSRRIEIPAFKWMGDVFDSEGWKNNTVEYDSTLRKNFTNLTFPDSFVPYFVRISTSWYPHHWFLIPLIPNVQKYKLTKWINFERQLRT